MVAPDLPDLVAITTQDMVTITTHKIW